MLTTEVLVENSRVTLGLLGCLVALVAILLQQGIGPILTTVKKVGVPNE